MCWRPFCYPQVLSSNVFNKHANNSIYIYIICKFWILELPNFTILAAHPEISINWDFPSYSESLTVLVSYSSVVNHIAVQLLYLTFNSMAIWRSWVHYSCNWWNNWRITWNWLKFKHIAAFSLFSLHFLRQKFVNNSWNLST